MSKMIELVCSECDKPFDKVKREYDRQVRNGRNYFFCSRHCTGKNNRKNLGNHLGMGRPENLIPYQFTSDEFSPFRHYLKKVRNRFIEKDKPYNVDLLYLKGLWETQKGICILTGVDLILENKISNPNFTASLDRIDSDVGYIEGNLRWISVTSNYAKNKYSDTIMQEYFSIIRDNL